MAQQLIADSVIDLETSRAADLARGVGARQRPPARHETSVAKAYVAEAVDRVVDRSVQICGGARRLRGDRRWAATCEVRPFRIYDGPTETHRWAIARRALRRHR